MKVFLCKDIPKIGFQGEIITVNEGYARNFLIPKKLGIEVTEKNKKFYESKIKSVENRKQAVATETSMLAEKINSMTLTVTSKMHDDGKLYGAINPSKIVSVLQEKGVQISKNQIKINKAIKTKGLHKIPIKLTSRLIPELTIHIVPE